MPQNGRTVLITGATSGIGNATAKLLATEGFRVFGTSRNPQTDRLDGFHLVGLEVTSNESVADCVTAVTERTGGQIDVLINNVGTGILGAAEESSAEQVQRLFDINFFGAMRMTNAVLPLMRSRKCGQILLMSSAGGISSLPYSGFYCATKHALEAYGEALRLEVERLGVQVSLVAPGTVSTPAGDKAMSPDRPQAEYEAERSETTKAYVQAIREGMNPDYVAKRILRILRSSKPKSRYVVGVQSAAVSAMKSLMPGWMFEAGAKRVVRK